MSIQLYPRGFSANSDVIGGQALGCPGDCRRAHVHWTFGGLPPSRPPTLGKFLCCFCLEVFLSSSAIAAEKKTRSNERPPFTTCQEGSGKPRKKTHLTPAFPLHTHTQTQPWEDRLEVGELVRAAASAPPSCPLLPPAGLHDNGVQTRGQSFCPCPYPTSPRFRELGMVLENGWGARYRRCSTGGAFWSIRGLPGRTGSAVLLSRRQAYRI